MLIFLLATAVWQPAPAHAAKNILVFGDSLSAGYGIDREKSWVNLLQQQLLRTGAKYHIVNASISGETTLGGRERIASALQQYRPAIVILELGANDGLRGYSISSVEANMTALIENIQKANAQIVLVGMKLPPNYGEPYITQFHNLYPRLAKKYRLSLLPFLLEGVKPDQFQADNLHPNEAAQPQLMRNVLKALQPLLR
ncbi:MAG TPA: arylesterase [Gallionella sp.]|nr:arylesterase [Gallionella sp.]